MNINKDKPIVGYPFAAPLSGKDTVERGLTQTHPHIAIIHMSTLLQVVIRENDHYKKIVQEGGLLPPEEAVKAFRRGFLEITKDRGDDDLPDIFGNGACRDDYETKMNVSLVRRLRADRYQQIGFRFLLDKEHIKARAAERVKEAQNAGKKPRPDDLGDVPVSRYEIFHRNLNPVLKVFEERGGIIIDIDANQTPQKVLAQVVSVYDYVARPKRVV